MRIGAEEKPVPSEELLPLLANLVMFVLPPVSVTEPENELFALDKVSDPAPCLVIPIPATVSPISPPKVSVLALTIMIRAPGEVIPPIVTAPVPRLRLCVPTNVKFRFSVIGFAVVSDTAPALVLSIRTTSVAAPPPKFRVPMPSAVALLMFSLGELATVAVAVESVTPPLMPELSPESVNVAPLLPDTVIAPVRLLLPDIINVPADTPVVPA